MAETGPVRLQHGAKNGKAKLQKRSQVCVRSSLIEEREREQEKMIPSKKEQVYGRKGKVGIASSSFH